MLSQNYLGLPSLDAPPSYAPLHTYSFDPDIYGKILMPDIERTYDVHDTPPFDRLSLVKPVRVDLHFTVEQVLAIQRAVRLMAPIMEDARVSRQDALWALLVHCMSKSGPDYAPEILSSIIMVYSIHRASRFYSLTGTAEPWHCTTDRL